MELTRRKFLLLSAAGIPGGLLTFGPARLLASGAGDAGGPASALEPPWHQRVRRIGQVNFNERDPVELNVEAWADYWASLKVDAVLVSVTGILAFYPTKVPFHRRSRFLGDGDLFGACAAAAKKRGLRVIARLSPDLQWEDALAPHPEWFMRDEAGGFIAHGEEPHLYKTCSFSTYFTEHIPAIMREVQASYDVDGLFTNAWPPLDGLPVCHCDVCRKLAKPKSVEYWGQYSDRTVELWRLYDSIAKEKKPDNLFLANMGAGISAAPNLMRVAEVCQWFNADNQGRGGDATPIWGASQQGRVASAVMKGRTVTNVTGAYATGGGYRWRNTAKSPEEAEMWMDETVASGMRVWYHWVGGQGGMGEDRRWQEVGRKYMEWHARREGHFMQTRGIANIGVVMGQSSHLLYKPPGEGAMGEFITGLYSTLLEGRFFFDFVHEDDLGPGTLGKYAVLLLPNIAWLSDRQCAQLRDYVAAGGSLMASFETGMYDGTGARRAKPGLADLFGIDSVGEVAAPNGNGFYARIERRHEILEGFDDTALIPGGGYRLPVRAAGEPILSSIPAYTAYPPELSYAPDATTDGPAVILREVGASRLAYFSGDLERASWRSGDTDLARLIRNTVTWLTRGSRPVAVAGDGIVECFAWETGLGFAVHVLNYTNPNLHRGWIREFYPIGEQKVRMELPSGRQVARVELLRAERDIPFTQEGSTVEFTIPGVVDYEVAALYA
jgi:hypothetical protein